MSQLILWFFVVLSGFPSMEEGTRLQIVSPDLQTVHGDAAVMGGQIVIQTALEPDTEVKLIISFEGNGNEPSVLEIYTATVDWSGEDLWLRPEDDEPPISLKEFLEEERNVRLFILPPDEN
jgi:hypothetical protein